MNKLIMFVVCVCVVVGILSSCSKTHTIQPLMEKSLTVQEKTREIGLIYGEFSLWKPLKIFATMVGIVLSRVALQKAIIDKQFFFREVEVNCSKTIGIKLKDLDKKVSRSRLDQEFREADSIIPPEVVNAPPVKLNREQLLDQRLPKQCTKDKIWVPRDDEGEHWVCVDYKNGRLDPLDEIYKDINNTGGDYKWKEIRESILK